MRIPNVQQLWYSAPWSACSRRLMMFKIQALQAQEDFELDALPGIAVFGQAHDTRLEPVAAVELASHGVVLGARNITQHVPVPLDAHRARIVRIVGLANQRQWVADPELIPQLPALVKLEPGERRALDQDTRRRLLRWKRSAGK